MTTDEEENPNPEELLKKIMHEEELYRKGKLKIFLGMAAGVGKTFAMLESAQKLKKQGVDVVVGVIKTHGRQETAQLLEGLEVIPEKAIIYKETAFEEFDLDKALQRKPETILIDEIAHTNVPGSRHLKRWQDVMEILSHGINVYTTLNVQHIESVKDIVEPITGVPIRETVPDQVIDEANSIELIDLTPEELLHRLKEGKVYLGDQSILAARNFFQEDRLTALREIVLRYAADKIDHDLKGLSSSGQRSDFWTPRERLLVAISHSPHSQKLIRATRRLSFNLDASWIALHVDTGKKLEEEDLLMLSKNLTLARELGAEVLTIADSNVPKAIQRISRQKGVTQIIVGRPPKHLFFDFFVGNKLIDQLARDCSNIDLHVIRQTIAYKPKEIHLHIPTLTGHFLPYLLVSIFVFFLSLLNWSLLPLIGYQVAGGLFLIGVLILSLFFKIGPTFFAAVLYALTWIAVFSPQIKDQNTLQEDLLLLSLYFLTAVCTGVLTNRVKKNSEILIKRERSIEALYDVVQDLTGLPSKNQVVISIPQRLNYVLEGHSEIAIQNQEDRKNLNFEGLSLFKNEKEQAAASWVFQNGKEAGWSTETLPFSQNLYIPLSGLKGIVGVLAYHSKENKSLSMEDKNFLYTVCQQLAHYLERSFEEDKSHEVEYIKEVEKLYDSLQQPLEKIKSVAKDLDNKELKTALGDIDLIIKNHKD